VDGFAVLDDLREEDENVKVIMITAHHDMESTINAMKTGPSTNITNRSTWTNWRWPSRRRSSVWRWKRRSTVSMMEPSRHFKVGDIIGSTKEMLEIFKTVGIVSQSRTTSLPKGRAVRARN
jgi:two-component system response regulator AtoC